MLDEKKLEAIDYLVEGLKTREEIAEIVGVADRTVYRWMNDKEFKAEWQKRSDDYNSSLAKESKSRMCSRVGKAIDNIWDLANNSDSDKIKLEANTIIYEAVLGKPTTKIEQTTTGDNNNVPVSITDMLEQVQKDNVIELPKDKAK
ncbi:helix-turn-helix domain-containing protein [Clostridium botulinum]|uniref:helix-turn-helix domain-containing protein n=1 Tax=Clostridium cagae TaxID=2080751 RepID=UPI0013CA367E|nr:helix-turn-helix domain-containing protein [Clostridium botulinum]NFI02589.1 helix-turn-helix domain-containing protein [Clostridium botulinum]NFI58227.1 helix-turn-helix domain-containing protein [Clostridium botulinum]NFI65010.1 helix-turn-helix domain-containing protein [Clostridium botulinum]NFJ45502.1 helix-turn-helix domain-containing protein [Clostridium botulinum]